MRQLDCVLQVIRRRRSGLATGRINIDDKAAWRQAAKLLSRLGVLCPLFVAAASGVLSGSADAAPIEFANRVLADNPLAFWRLNESPGATTALDASGNAQHGAYSTTGITLGMPGLAGGDNAALFDGLGSGRVVVPDSATVNPSLITIESLFSWAGPNGFQQRIAEKSREFNGHIAIYGLSINDDGTVQVEISTGTFPTTVVHFLTSFGLVQSGAITHLAATHDGNQLAVYINGVIDNSLAIAATLITDSNEPLGLGNQEPRNRAFNGIIDEIALYDHALSASALLFHYQAVTENQAVEDLAVPEPATLTLWGLGLLGFVGHLRKRWLKRGASP